MHNKKLVTLVLATLMLTLPSLVMVNAGTGSLRIDPTYPAMTESPAEFTIWVQPNDDAYNPYILLVMTDSCHEGLTGNVMVSWDGGSVAVSGWTMEDSNGAKIPDGATNGAKYTVASLKDHLDTDEAIWWAMAPILDGPIMVGETYDITVTMTSSDPKMLVYLLGQSSEEASMFDMNVPNTIPGFVVPEVPLGTLVALVTMVAAVSVYRVKRK